LPEAARLDALPEAARLDALPEAARLDALPEAARLEALPDETLSLTIRVCIRISDYVDVPRDILF